MLSLPTELQIYIFELATDVPHLFDIAPDPADLILPKDDIETLLEVFRASLPTRHALTLVSRTFNALATPILYACLLLKATSIPSLRASFNISNAIRVCHVILDFLWVNESTHLAHDLASIFSLLPDVHILSLHMRWDTGPRHPPPAFSNPSLIRAMVDSLGRTLRKLVLYRIALGLFPADHLSEFTSSLARLETIVSPALYLPNYANHNIDRIPLPNQLSCCRYLNIGGAPFVLPVDIAPTHVHRPRPTILSSILTPSLTHLSIHLSSNIPDAYANFSTAAPNLVSLTLVGYLATVTRFLAVHTFPPLQILLIDYIYYVDDGVAEVVPWLEALANVRAVRVVRVPDRELWALLRLHVEEDSDVRARFCALKTCGFVLQDEDGIPVFEDGRMGIASPTNLTSLPPS